MTTFRCGLVLLLSACALGGCATQRASVSGLPSLQGRTEAFELSDTPFYPQSELQCGPAALATVLGAAGVETPPERLVDEVYTPGLGGSLQLELIAAARARGFLPYRILPEPDALVAELLAGRPVLVLQNLKLRSLPAWHYAVVIGVDPAREQWLLRSGTERRHTISARRFARSWDLADRWAVVLLEPGQLPARPDRQRYAEAVVGLEETGRYGPAAAAWGAALELWPEDPVARFGQATAHHLAGDLDRARAGYESLLETAPDHAAALNNLASLMADAGCPATARSLALRAVEAAAAGSEIASAAADTLENLPPDTGDGSGCASAGQDAP